MAHVLDQLLADHRNLEKVMAVLEQEIERFADEDDAPDMALVMEIMDYIHAYPEYFHHPLEEVAMGYLNACNLGDQGQIDAVRDDHERLEEEGERLRQLVNAIHMGRPVHFDRLRQALRDFAEHQRRHMRHEENTVFLAFRQLSQEDSDTIQAQLESLRDPIFTEVGQRQYGSLMNRLGGSDSAHSW